MIYTLGNKLGREIKQQQAVRWPGNKSIEMNVQGISETMLKCKTKRWRLVYLTWNVIVYQDFNTDPHEYRSGFAMKRALCTNQYNTMLRQGQQKTAQYSDLKRYPLIQQIQMKEYILENLTSNLKTQKLDKHKLTDKRCYGKGCMQ